MGLIRPKDQRNPGGIWSGDMWIPWANNWAEFRKHHMWIAAESHIWASNSYNNHLIQVLIWQEGEFVRMRNIRDVNLPYDNLQYGIPVSSMETFINITNLELIYSQNAGTFPGEARAGGDRKLIVYEDDQHRILYRLEKF
jgi:hypothetical protein